MTLASSGYISLGGTDPARSANLAAGQAATATITMPSSVTRTLTGVASGPIVLPNNYWGKPSGVVVNIDNLVGSWQAYYTATLPVAITLSFATNGAMTMNSNGTPSILLNTTWASPITTGVGSSYWINWTLVGTLGSTGSATASSSGRLQLSTARGVTVSKSSGGGTFFSAEYDFEIWDAASGGTRVGYAPGVTLDALRIPP